jgi:hypothetical protein
MNDVSECMFCYYLRKRQQGCGHGCGCKVGAMPQPVVESREPDSIVSPGARARKQDQGGAGKRRHLA